MILELDLHGGVPIYRQVMNEIRRQVLTGHLPEGQQLESVKNLSERLKVNPMTISKAYSFLVEEGLLERRRGVGLFVKAVRRDTMRRKQDALLNGAVQKVVTLALQMKIPEREVVRLLREHYREVATSEEASQNP